MKMNLLKILFVFIPLVIFAQEEVKKNRYFVALYTVGESWDTEKQPKEQTYFKEHSAHLAQLRAEGIITVGARYSDTGMIVIKTKDMETAEDILRKDIAVANKLFAVEIHPFSPFYKGCLE
ncbi:MAG: hypothetical protein WBG90_03840 [Saonia sp.]